MPIQRPRAKVVAEGEKVRREMFHDAVCTTWWFGSRQIRRSQCQAGISARYIRTVHLRTFASSEATRKTMCKLLLDPHAATALLGLRKCYSLRSMRYPVLNEVQPVPARHSTWADRRRVESVVANVPRITRLYTCVIMYVSVRKVPFIH